MWRNHGWTPRSAEHREMVTAQHERAKECRPNYGEGILQASARRESDSTWAPTSRNASGGAYGPVGPM